MNNRNNKNEIEDFLNRTDDCLMSKGDIRKRKRELYNKGNHLFKYFTVKDFVFIAIASAAMIVSCFVMPLMNAIPIFGMGFIGISFQVCFFQAVIASKIRKIGSVFCSSFILGVFHLAMAPHMMLFCIISGIICELIACLFMGYRNTFVIIFVCGLLSSLIMVSYVTYDFILLGDQAFDKLYIENWWIPTIIGAVELILGYSGSTFGALLMKKLKKKGALHE